MDRPVPGDGEVRIRVHAAGVDPGVWHLVTGLPYPVRMMSSLSQPRVAGWDVAGEIEAVGSNVTRFRVGDEVFGACAGSFAEYACARETRLAKKPANLTFVQAAATTVSGITALQGLRNRGEVKAGHRVLITGAGGGVGTFAVQIARAFGAEVTGVCGAGKTDLVRSIGADHTIDYTREDFTAGRGRWDVILDIAGNRPLSRLRRALTPRGTLVLVGGEGGGAWLAGLGRFFRAWLLSPLVRQRIRPMLARGNSADLEVLKGLIEAGTVTPVIGRTYPLSAAAEALRYLEAGHALGKVVLTV